MVTLSAWKGTLEDDVGYVVVFGILADLLGMGVVDDDTSTQMSDAEGLQWSLASLPRGKGGAVGYGIGRDP